MQFEKYFRDIYNEEKFVKYGFKQERRVLRIIDDQCNGMFKTFLSQRLSKKKKRQLSLEHTILSKQEAADLSNHVS